MKLGKLPAAPKSTDFKLTQYLTALPKRPTSFGHEKLISEWGMLGNDRHGDCVFAGAAHETMLWNAAAGRTVPFTTEGVLSDYSAVTGFNPNDPNTDNGTMVADAMSYRRKTGIVDAFGVRHKIGAYVSIRPRNYEQFLSALWMFGIVGVGIRFPSSAMQQFSEQKVWRATQSPIDGGHYVPVVANRAGQPMCVTWGRLQRMTRQFYLRYCDEAYVLLSEGMLTNGKSPEGFDMEKLLNDLGSLQK